MVSAVRDCPCICEMSNMLGEACGTPLVGSYTHMLLFLLITAKTISRSVSLCWSSDHRLHSPLPESVLCLEYHSHSKIDGWGI